jgi:serine/threonine protein kinase
MKVCPQCERQYGDDVQYCAHDGATLRDLEGEAEDPMIGRVLDGRWRIEEKLGEGGMGSIYLASQQSVGRQVAIKTLRTALSDSEEFVDRFMQEARVTTTISHPHCVTILDFGKTDNGLLYLAMELLEGEPLSERLSRGRLPLEQSLQIGIQVASALAAAHDHNIIHRDLKPENIFVLDITDDSTFIKVLDFGISKDLDDDQGMTKTGQLFGTPQYMSPEQCRGEDLDGRSDIYSLGCILYELISGRPPFQSDKSMNILVAHVQEEIPPLDEVTDRPLPEGVVRAVMAMLSKEPSERPATAKAVRTRLKTLLSRFDTSSSPAPTDSSGVGTAQTLAAPEDTSPVEAGMQPQGAEASKAPDEEFGGSGSKMMVIVGILGVFFLFGVGVLGAGYWWYSGQQGLSLASIFGDDETEVAEVGLGAGPDGETASADASAVGTGTADADEPPIRKNEGSERRAKASAGAGAAADNDSRGESEGEPDDEGGESAGSGRDPSDDAPEDSPDETSTSDETATSIDTTSNEAPSDPESSGEEPDSTADSSERQPPDSDGVTADEPPSRDEPSAEKPVAAKPTSPPEPSGPAPADFVSSRDVQAAGSACDSRDVRRKLDAVTGAIGRCVADHADAMPASVMLDWTILTEGDPMDVSVIKSDLSGGSVEQCIVSAVSGVRFSPLGGGRCYTRVTYKFRRP